MQITYAETDFSPVTYKNVCLSCVLDNKGKDFLTAKKKEEEEYYYKQEKQGEEETLFYWYARKYYENSLSHFRDS
jgi:hypothetical protein